MAILNRPEKCKQSIELLAKAGIDQRICDGHGRSGLFYLMMSAEDSVVFKDTLEVLLQNGLDLNAPLKDSTQFGYCCWLLRDFISKNPQVDITSKAHIAANLAMMIELGADVGKTPNWGHIYFALPPAIQQKLNVAKTDSSSESAGTPPRGSPVRLSESPTKTSPISSSSLSSGWLTDLWWDLPDDLSQKIDPRCDANSQAVVDFKTRLGNVLQQAGLGFVLSSQGTDPMATALRKALISPTDGYLRPLVMKGALQASGEVFERNLMRNLTEWKAAQSAAEIEKRQKPIDAQAQQLAFQQVAAKIEKAAATAQAAAKVATEQAANAEFDASRAGRSSAAAASSAGFASFSATTAHGSAMTAMTARQVRY